MVVALAATEIVKTVTPPWAFDLLCLWSINMMLPATLVCSAAGLFHKVVPCDVPNVFLRFGLSFVLRVALIDGLWVVSFVPRFILIIVLQVAAALRPVGPGACRPSCHSHAVCPSRMEQI